MKDYKAFFAGKRITLMGLGLLGRGVGDAEFLASLVKELVVTDLKTKEELAASVSRLEKFPNIRFELGGHKLEDFQDVDMVIKAAGVPLDSPYLSEARKHNIPVRMSADLLVELAEVKTVGVTGTRGKSTVVHLIAHALKQAGKKVLMGGNIRGVSNLSLLPQVEPDIILVLELDSWQLQGFGEAHMSPNIAVFTNFMPDHLNYYKGDMNAYFADKANIFKYQKEGDVFIGGKSVIQPDIPHAQLPSEIPADWKLKIEGAHNRENASFARAALQKLALSEEEIRKGLESFEAVEGRLQFVREVNGIRIYNDNNATIPEATIAALQALGHGTVLIMGGADKNLDMSALIKEAKGRCKKVILLAGTGTEKIKSEFPDAPVYDSLESAIEEAMKSGEKGDAILFSPAFASFGMFKNEYDRNDQFMKIIQSL